MWDRDRESNDLERIKGERRHRERSERENYSEYERERR